MTGFYDHIMSDELAKEVWFSKYALKDEQGEYVEDHPQQRIQKIIEEIVRIEEKYDTSDDLLKYTEELTQLMETGAIIPGGSCLFGIGNPGSNSSLSNCFVISGNNEDSYGSILRTDQEIVQIAKRRGGVGHDMSHLRPRKALVHNAAKSSTGTTSFMHRYSNSSREVAQDGRRGALMLSLDIRHPDALVFTNMKKDKVSVTGANISLRITDEFMKAVTSEGDFILRFPIDIPANKESCEKYNTEYHSDDGVRVKIKAQSLWDNIIQNSWASAEPGILFWDTVQNNSIADAYEFFRTVSTNPCGEIPLSPYDSCRLLSLILTAFVEHPFTKDAYINEAKLIRAIEIATKTMDIIVDLEIEKIKSILKKLELDPESNDTKSTEINLWNKILDAANRGRRLGISFIGHGDLLAMLGLDYGSEKSIAVLAHVHELLKITAYKESARLAEIKGAFPEYDMELERGNHFAEKLYKKVDRVPRRNVALLTIPPSGSLSIIAGITSGMEPVFKLFYTRRRKVTEDSVNVKFVDDLGDKWEEYNVVHPGFQRWLQVAHHMSDIEINSMTVDQLKLYVKDSPYAGQTAEEIDPLRKIILQGALQEHIDHSISITHNLPSTASKKDVEDIMLAAWAYGCKGCTIYRDGVRSGVLIDSTVKNTSSFKYSNSHKRPKVVKCDVHHTMYQGKKYIVLVGLIDNIPYEVFVFNEESTNVPTGLKTATIVKQKSKFYNLVKDDGTVVVTDILNEMRYPEQGFVTKLISLSLRHGADIKFVLAQLDDEFGNITDLSKVLARIFRKYIKSEELRKGKPCPNCGTILVIEGGCPQCKQCGYSVCS